MDMKGRSVIWSKDSDWNSCCDCGGYSAEYYSKKMKDMSLVYCLRTKTAVYVVADSRSTTSFENDVAKEYYDTYRKIARSGNYYYAATGENIYDGMTLTQLVSKCSSPNEVKEIVSKYNTTLFIFSNSSEQIKCQLFGKANYLKDILINEYENHFSSNEILCDVISKIRVPKTDDDIVVVDFLNDVFSTALNLSKWDSNTVGGPIHILKLTPGKEPVWLQNGYEL